LALVLLSPGPSVHIGHWPRSADIWATAALVNITIDDTSSLIAYSANNTWRSSAVACSTCLAPDIQLAYAGSWHDGTHIIPTTDADDLGDTDATTHSSTAKQQPDQGDHDKDDGDNDSDDKKGGGHRRGLGADDRAKVSKRQSTDVDNPFFTPKLDDDDPGFVDTQVTLQFSFNGTSYLEVLYPSFVRLCLSIHRDAGSLDLCS
jgi:hypothetical protein